MKLHYAIIEDLNGNYKLKTLSQAEKAFDNIEMEIYGDTLAEIKTEYKAHLNELKEMGFL
jgi:hypothetical protein